MMRLTFSVPLLIVVFCANIFAQNPPLSNSLEAVIVKTSDWNSLSGTARLFERQTLRSKWKAVGSSFSVVVGKNGLAWSDDARMKAESEPHKREGDGRAPAGIFNLTFAFGASAKPGFVRLPYTKFTEWTECVDDSKSSHYNRIVERMKVGNFDWKSSEKMIEVGSQYDLGVFVAHNSNPPQPERGSCIFLHIWKNESTGTAGCTAMARADLEKILGWLEPGKNPVLVQLPETNYQRFQKLWKLPKTQ